MVFRHVVDAVKNWIVEMRSPYHIQDLEKALLLMKVSKLIHTDLKLHPIVEALLILDKMLEYPFLKDSTKEQVELTMGRAWLSIAEIHLDLNAFISAEFSLRKAATAFNRVQTRHVESIVDQRDLEAVSFRLVEALEAGHGLCDRCKYRSISKELLCAVNPSGPVDGHCPDFEVCHEP